MIGAISQISKEDAVNYFQKAAQISTIGGGITSVACAIIGQDYTYPCTVTVLGACAWLSIWMTQSAKQEAVKHQKDVERKNKTAKEFVQEELNSSIDALGVSVKEKLKNGRDTLVDMGINTAKIAVLGSSSLSPYGAAAASVTETSLKLGAESTKGISNKSIDSSVDLMGNGLKKSTTRSVNSIFSSQS